MKLINHLTKSDKSQLQKLISNDVYDMPTLDEVIEYLENTEDSEPSEEIFGDLVVQYIDGRELCSMFVE